MNLTIIFMYLAYFLAGCPETYNRVNRFDFVFLLRLRNVTKNSTLAELIVAQHGKLENDDIELIDIILRGKTRHQVLLMLDGYDEYRPGTNVQIDRAIQYSIGNCFLIVTSRPELPFCDGHHLPKEIRDSMDFELTIEGFSQDNIRKCCTQYLHSPEKSERLLQQAMRVGIDNLLKVPIILLMVCVLFSEGEALPKARTKIVSKIFELTINRTTLKSLSPEEYTEFKKSFNDLMHALGELSWKALRQNVPRLAVNKVGLLFPKSFVKLKDKNEKAYKDPNQRFLGHLNLMCL